MYYRPIIFLPKTQSYFSKKEASLVMAGECFLIATKTILKIAKWGKDLFKYFHNSMFSNDKNLLEILF